MRVQGDFESKDSPALVQDRIARYLKAVGYRPESREGGLVFRRGSLLRGWFSMSPKMWRTRVTIQVRPAPAGGTAAAVDFNVSTRGQTITPGELQFFDAELRGLAQAMAEGEMAAAGHEAAERAAVHGNWKYLGKMLLMTLLGIAVLAPVWAVAWTVGQFTMQLMTRLASLLNGVVVTAIPLAIVLAASTAIMLSTTNTRPRGRFGAHRDGIRRWVMLVLVYFGVVVVFGTILGLFSAAMAFARRADSPAIWAVVISFIATFLAIGLISDRRTKKARSKGASE